MVYSSGNEIGCGFEDKKSETWIDEIRVDETKFC